MKKNITKFNASLKLLFFKHSRQDGVTAIEYALLAALIAVVIIAGVTLLGTTLDGFFSALAVKINSYKPT